jgi:hypothetical protein
VLKPEDDIEKPWSTPWSRRTLAEGGVMVSIFDAFGTVEIPEKQYLSVPLVIRGGWY